MPTCCVPFCKSSNKSNASFHQFPSDENLCKIWINNVSRKDFGVNEAYASCSLVCSLHFKESDYCEGLKIRKLKKGAFPTIFQEDSKYTQTRHKYARKTTEKKLEPPKLKILNVVSIAGVDQNISSFEEPGEPFVGNKATERIIEHTPSKILKVTKHMQTKHKYGKKTTERNIEPPPSKNLKVGSTSTVQDAKVKQNSSSFKKHSIPAEPLVHVANKTTERNIENPPSASTVQDARVNQNISTFEENLVPDEPLVGKTVEETLWTSTNLPEKPTLESIMQMKRTIITFRSKVRRQNQKLQDQQEIINSLQTQLSQFNKPPIKKVKQLMTDAFEKKNEAIFLLNIICNYKKKRPTWSEAAVRQCAIWNISSPKGYSYPTKNGILSLPSKRTLKKFIGGINRETGVPPMT